MYIFMRAVHCEFVLYELSYAHVNSMSAELSVVNVNFMRAELCELEFHESWASRM